MRILVLTLYFAPDIAANAVIVTQLCEELQRLNHQITVVTAFPHYEGNRVLDRYRGKIFERENYQGINVVRTYIHTLSDKRKLGGRFLSYLSFHVLSTLAGLLLGEQDVIVAPSPPLTIGLSAYLIGKAKGAPFVYNVQDIYPNVAIKLGLLGNKHVISLFRWLEDFVYSRAGHVTVLSEGFLDNLTRKGVPRAKLSVIPNFVDIQFIRPLPRVNSVAQRLGFSGKFVVMYAGNIGFSQALETVLHCAKHLAHCRDILFAIVGDGAARSDLERTAKGMGLTNVRFIPFQPRADLPLLRASADVSLVPLKRGIAYDSVPSKVYEIMASGRPVIVAVDKDSDTWKLVDKANCGLCVEPEDPLQLAEAIRQLSQDSALRDELGDNGRRYVVSHYARPVVARRYHQLLVDLMSSNAR